MPGFAFIMPLRERVPSGKSTTGFPALSWLITHRYARMSPPSRFTGKAPYELRNQVINVAHEEVRLGKEVHPARYACAKKRRVEIALVVGNDDERAHRGHILRAIDLPIGEQAHHQSLYYCADSINQVGQHCDTSARI